MPSPGRHHDVTGKGRLRDRAASPRYHRHVTRDPDANDEQPAEGGRAAERLREFLAARFGDEAPPIPPDEDAQAEEDVAARRAGDDDADVEGLTPSSD